MAANITLVVILSTIFSSTNELHEQINTNNTNKTVPMNCKDIQESRAANGKATPNDIYKVYPYKDNTTQDVEVYCDMDTDGGGWTVFQRRDKVTPHISFYRTWKEYALGFGDLDGEFWLGLDNIHALTDQKNMTLRIDMEDFNGNTKFVQYNSIYVDDRSKYFKLQVSGYTGNAGDSLSYHNNMLFSAKDLDKDNAKRICTDHFKGGWWYNDCHQSNLNGLYHGGSHSSYGDGINWYTWRGNKYSMKKTEMKIRPRSD